MPVEREKSLPSGISVDIEMEEGPEIEIELDDEGGATVKIDEEADDVEFDANLAEVLPEDVLSGMSDDLMLLFEADQASRQDWDEMYAKGLELLGFSMEERTKPFKGACGVQHPLLSEAIVQFQSQALKELMPAGGPVRTQVLGKETRERLMQAQRVKDFMNYQITIKMPEYTPDVDQLLFHVGYGGSAFKKVYFDHDKNRMVSKLIPADNLYIPYYGSSVMTECERITYRVPMSMNAYRKAVVRGQYLDLAEPSVDNQTSQIREAQDKELGVSPSGEEEEIFLLEFQVDYDLPGFEDKDKKGEPTGIKLPYIITIEEISQKVVGVRRNWIEDSEDKRREEYYVHYILVQGPGAYGLGFLHLIGGLTKTASASLRQLTDAGTLVNLPAGFKAKGARIENDDIPISPGEWRDMDAGGMDLTQSLLPLPYKEPSQTLFTLMNFCVESGRRMASITDMQVGDSNQNAAVGTTIALLEKGSTVMSAIHKRLHYSQGLELRMLAQGFAKYLPPEYPYDVPGESRKIKARDFDDRIDVIPVSDPNIFSVAQRITMAQTQLQLAQSAPQMHNMYEAYRRMYEAIGVRDVDSILTSQDVDKPKDPASENSQVLDGSPLKAFAGQQHDAHIVSHIMMGLSPLTASVPNVAMNLAKHIFDHIRLKAEEFVEAELFKLYGTDPDKMISPLEREARVAIKVAEFQKEVKDLQDQMSGANQQPPDPLIELKKQELAQSAQRDQARNQVDMQKLSLEQQREQNDMSIDQARMQQTEQLAQERNAVALAKMNQTGGPRGNQVQ
jgi:hypothetical protein